MEQCFDDAISFIFLFLIFLLKCFTKHFIIQNLREHMDNKMECEHSVREITFFDIPF